MSNESTSWEREKQLAGVESVSVDHLVTGEKTDCMQCKPMSEIQRGVCVYAEVRSYETAMRSKCLTPRTSGASGVDKDTVQR